MINVIVWGPSRVEIEGKLYELEQDKETENCLVTLINKIKYSGERICLETASINVETGLVNYKEIQRW